MLAPSDIIDRGVRSRNSKVFRTREKQKKLAQAALNFQRGRPQAEAVLLANQDSIIERGVDPNSAVQLAHEHRPDLQAARSKLAAGRAEITVARSAFLADWRDRALCRWYDDQLFGDHGASWAIMGQAKLNLFHGGADRNAWKKATLDAQAGQHDVRRFEEGVELEVRQAFGRALIRGTQTLCSTCRTEIRSRKSTRNRSSLCARRRPNDRLTRCTNRFARTRSTQAYGTL